MTSPRWPLACPYALQGIGQADAQDLQLGLQISQAIPFSDLGSGALLDRALGYGVGTQILVRFAGGHALLPRIDCTNFEKTSPTRTVRMVHLGADYNFFLSRKVKQGGYVGAGLGLGLAKFDFESPEKHDSDLPTSPYGAVSAGYMFDSRTGSERRYIRSKYKPRLFGSSQEISTPTLNISFFNRF